MISENSTESVALDAGKVAPMENLTLAVTISSITKKLFARSLIEVTQQRPRRRVLSGLAELVKKEVMPVTKEAFTALMRNWEKELPNDKKRGKNRASTHRGLLTVEEVTALLAAYTPVPFNDPRVVLSIGEKIESYLLGIFSPRDLRVLAVEEIDLWEAEERDKPSASKSATGKSVKKPASESPPDIPTDSHAASIGIGPEPRSAAASNSPLSPDTIP